MNKWVNGVLTAIETGNHAPAVNDRSRIDADGTTIRLLKNDVVEITVTDTAVIDGSAGVFIFETIAAGPALDNFVGGELGANTRTLLGVGT